MDKSWPIRSLVGVGLFLTAQVVWAEPSSDATRGLKPREYAERIHGSVSSKRPRAQATKATPAAAYHPVTNGTETVAEGVDVGVTIWRLRPALHTDAKEIQEPTRLAVRKQGDSQGTTVMMTPVRAKSETLFSDGDLVKFTIESPFPAHIYIISREQYEDGTFSEPYLIFPASDDININNKGRPGRLLFLPSTAADDKFVLTRLDEPGGKSPKTAEIFTIILHKSQIQDLPPLKNSDVPRKINQQTFQRWQSSWGGQVWKFEMQSTSEASMTYVEKQAGVMGGRLLGADDPAPQTVYHVGRKSADVILFDVALTILR